jgi:hypothetical protein
MIKIEHIVRLWVPIAVVAALLSGLVYLGTQQVIRAGANDPQIQLAEDIAAELSSGHSSNGLVATQLVDVASSLAPFVIVFDDSGIVRTSSGRLHDATPALPPGVLDYVRANGEDRITWQPEPGVRIAAVVTRYTGKDTGFVLAGRNMREAERREDLALSLAALGGGATLLAALLAIIAVDVAFASRQDVSRATSADTVLTSGALD